MAKQAFFCIIFYNNQQWLQTEPFGCDSVELVLEFLK